jgi:P-type E1-E2 ATPase
MQFTKMALIACILVLVLSIVMIGVKMAQDKWWEVLITKSMKLINLIVVLFVVILPEGLPLTVGVSLAFTTSRMFKKDRILVRNLEAPEVMGSVNEVLVGKTNTITAGNMKMSQFLCEDKQIKNTRKNTLLHCELSE